MQDDIDNLIARFFSAFDNRGRRPALTGLADCFTGKAVVVRWSAVGADLYTVEEFALPRLELLCDGRLSGFHEAEISSSTHIHGGIATRTSRYEKAGRLDGEAFTGCGIKCFQLVKGKDGWRIASLAWVDDE